jgi:glycosyltransferase involved in cell wall biosynthesis
MKRITMIKASNPTDVRFYKYIRTFLSNNYTVKLVCWKRNDIELQIESDGSKNIEVNYILKGFNNKYSKAFGYLFWYFLLIKHILFSKKGELYYCADFEGAFPCFLLKKIKRIRYTYDIYDEFAIRYKFSKTIKELITAIDIKMRKASVVTIHVDASRVSKSDQNYIVIPNIPFDFYNGQFITPEYKEMIAITGWLTKTRGFESILKFAADSPHIEFIIVGEIDNSILKNFHNLPNISVFSQMPQQEVFKLIKSASLILALYDPKIEINRKAAPNKLYDAMMLGIPIATNEKIEVAEFIKSNSIGLAVNYDYDISWSSIIELISDKSKVKMIGEKSRNMFEERFDFSKCIQNDLLTKLDIQ